MDSDTSQGAYDSSVSSSPKVKKKKIYPDSWYLGALKEPPLSPQVTIAPVIPLTKDQWEAMDGKARWDSMVALRGPDLVASNTVKWFTTSIIRHRMSGVMRVGGMVNDQWPFLIIPRDASSVSRGIRGGFDWAHFIGHVVEAASWLGIPYAKVPPQAWKRTIVAGFDSGGSLKKLHGFLNDPYQAYVGKFLTTYGVTPEGTSWLDEDPSKPAEEEPLP